METSAPKRRKLSPEQSVAVNNNNQKNDPDDNPRDDQTTTTKTPPDPSTTAPPRSPERPSFASPTRASLARHNPDVLGKRQTAGRGKSPARANPGASRQPPPREDAGLNSEAPLQHEPESELAARDASSVPDAPRGGLFAKPRRSPVRTIAPRSTREPEPPNPFQGRTLRRSFPRPEQPEPELPQAPGPPDPVLSTPPSGIHNTPSKRPRRSRALAEQLKSSSPAKPKAAPPTQPSEVQQDPAWTLPSKPKVRHDKQVLAAGDIGSDGAGQILSLANAADSREERARRRAIRGIDDSQDVARKKRERDELLAEVARLEADVQVLTQAQNGQVDVEASVKNATADVLRRHLLRKDKGISSEKRVSDSDAQWLELAMNPMSFLPFGNANSSQLPSLFAPESQAKDEKPLPTSHHPIPMTAEDELPFLQVFTPLSFTSIISILPRQSTADPLLQQHTISASSATPPGLFTAQISMIVNAATHRVHSLSVPRLDPAAAPELATMIAATTTPTAGAGRGRQNNVCVLAWAMGEWVRVATRRARFWRVLESELASKEAMAAAVAMARSRNKKNNGKKGASDGRSKGGRNRGDDNHQRQEDNGDDEDEDDDDSNGSLGKRSDLLSRAELLPHMGRTAMEIGVPVAADDDTEAFSLRIQWRIRFDWTGEAESEVELLTGVPGKWRRSDERGKLYGIPNLFKKLVEGDGDPIAAVRAVVALLAGDGA